MVPRCTHPRFSHRLSPGSKLFFGMDVGWLTCWIVSYDSCDMEHAALGSVFRASESPEASSGLPGPPAGGCGKDGRIHNDKLRHSTAAQREVAPRCLYICCHHFLYISILCWREPPRLGPKVYSTLSGVSPREAPFRSIDLGGVALRSLPT